MSSEPITLGVPVGSDRSTATGRVALAVHGLEKVYDQVAGGLRWRMLLPGFEHRVRRPLHAIGGIDLTVHAGESVGLIGPNGAGKSTLLKVIAGVSHATAGSVEVAGSTASMIELGVGFHPELTGWENLRCSAAIRGIPADALDQALPEIVAFADLAEAMATPLKKYSTGMKARLGFALATQFPADVLLVDEVLAVGDPDFQAACLARIRSMLDQGTALVFVSHEMRLVTLMCSRVVHMSAGKVVDDGDPPSVIARYVGGAPAHRATDADPALTMSTLRTPEHLGEGDPWEISAEVVVRRPLANPRSVLNLVDLSAPDVTFPVSGDALELLRQPGRYRVIGSGSGGPLQNIGMRVELGIADDGHLLDSSDRNVWFEGVTADMSFLAFRPTWSIAPAPPAHERPARHGGPGVDGSMLRIRSLSKSFRAGRAVASMRAVVPGRSAWSGGERVEALVDIDLDVGRGEAVGIIGHNGAGKSTLLSLLAGVSAPDRGTIEVGGRTVPLLDLGGGFHGELTGRENLRVRAAVLGLDLAADPEVTEKIVAFSGLGEAIDLPVRQYSSGMRGRLGFAIAICTPGDLLLVDEVLTVGDERFRRAAVAALAARRAEGATILFVSHELQLVEQVCDRVIRLDHGRVRDDGPAPAVIDAYSGSAWVGGISDATGGVRLLPLQVRQRKLTIGGTMSAWGILEVDIPAPGARVEVSYRVAPLDRQLPITSTERSMRSFFSHTVATAGGVLEQPGRYRYELEIPDNQISGEFDLVVAVIDDRGDEVLAETWQSVMVGYPTPFGRPHPVVTFSWRVEEVAG